MNEKHFSELQEKINAARRLHTVGVALYVTRVFEKKLMLVKDGVGQFIYQLRERKTQADAGYPAEVYGVPAYPILDNSIEERPFRLVVEL